MIASLRLRWTIRHRRIASAGARTGERSVAWNWGACAPRRRSCAVSERRSLATVRNVRGASRYVVEDSPHGRSLVVTGRWSNAAAQELASGEIDELVLNYA